jgi:2-polyprenyl-3-methyl-5-hydroxy-6-metoxy-1,4-benzoquinol methylase
VETPVQRRTSQILLSSPLGFLRQTVFRAIQPILPESILARGAYRPPIVPPEYWDNEYRSGSMSNLSELRDLGRYNMIVGYFNFFHPGGTVLDVGCGEGILQQKLKPFAYRYYVGIDISEIAIASAMTHADDRSTFIRADLTTFASSQKFDLIVFNEILYYLADPLSVIERFSRSLEPDGLMVASIWADPQGSRRALKVWRMIDSVAKVVDSTTVSNRDTWTIKVFQPV